MLDRSDLSSHVDRSEISTRPGQNDKLTRNLSSFHLLFGDPPPPPIAADVICVCSQAEGPRCAASRGTGNGAILAERRLRHRRRRLLRLLLFIHSLSRSLSLSLSLCLFEPIHPPTSPLPSYSGQQQPKTTITTSRQASWIASIHALPDLPSVSCP